jgi:hypothetical protein
VNSSGWILRVQPSLPDLWDKWYATYAPRLDDVADDDIMANPLGEAKLAKKELKGEDILKAVRALPPSLPSLLSLALSLSRPLSPSPSLPRPLSLALSHPRPLCLAPSASPSLTLALSLPRPSRPCLRLVMLHSPHPYPHLPTPWYCPSRL